MTNLTEIFFYVWKKLNHDLCTQSVRVRIVARYFADNLSISHATATMYRASNFRSLYKNETYHRFILGLVIIWTNVANIYLREPLPVYFLI